MEFTSGVVTSGEVTLGEVNWLFLDAGSSSRYATAPDGAEAAPYLVR
jgi:hypothetical protein